MRTTLPAILLPLSAALLLATSVNSQAQPLGISGGAPDTSIDRSFEASPKDCADVRWSQAVLQSFPSIGSACQAIEQRNGKTYVKLAGSVESVRNGGKQIRVDFKDGGTLTFQPTPQTALYMDGKRTPFASLANGTGLNFYIPEDRLQAEVQPDPNRVAFLIFPIAVRPSPDSSMAMNSRELPRTAGPLPLLALGGGLSLLAGGIATFRRKLTAKRS